MANRRQLKKTISYIADEMLNELYTKALFSDKELDEEKIGALTGRILSQCDDFRRRISHSNGKEPKMVKEYYSALYQSWDKSIGEIWDEIEQL